MTRLVALFALALVGAGPTIAASPDWYAKVDPWVQEATADGATAEYLVYLTEQADLSAAAGLARKSDKGGLVYDRLTEVANRTQGPLLAMTGGSVHQHPIGRRQDLGLLRGGSGRESG